MDDLISRQAAIAAIKALWDGAPTAQHVSAMFDCEDAIQALPSAQAERKTGRWIPLNDQIAKCSSCGAMESTFGKDRTGHALIHKAIKHYCPNCGAKMDEVSE